MSVLRSVGISLTVVFVYFGFVLIGLVMSFIIIFFGRIIGSWSFGVGITVSFFSVIIGIGAF